MSNYTVGSITYSPNYSIQAPQKAATKTGEEDLEQMRRELRQLRRVAFQAAIVISVKADLSYLPIALDRLNASLDRYEQDKD